MVNVDLRSLVGKISPTLKEFLEKAANSAVVNTNFSIELDHLFLQCLMENESKWNEIISQGKISKDSLIERVSRDINTLPKGNTQSPSLSPSVIELFKDAWLLASINSQQGQITELHLLLVLKERVNQASYGGSLLNWVSELSETAIKTAISALKIGSLSTSVGGASGDANVGTAALDKYASNVTEAARNGKLDAVIGRIPEIRKAIDILCRRRQNSPILVGDPGVGKTAIVEGLAQEILKGNVPEQLKNVELYSLDLSALQAGASIKGEFENRLKDVLNEIKQSPKPIIMFIDEAHTLIGAGGAAGQNDAANILKPALARGEIKSIAATTWAEYKQYFEADAALTRRFQLVAVQEPSAEIAMEMLAGIKETLEKHHHVSIKQEAIESAVKMSIRYLPERKLPDKAISLLDTACSRIGLSQSTTPQKLDTLKEEISCLNKELESLKYEDAIWGGKEEKIVDIQESLAQKQAEVTELEEAWKKEKDLVAKIVDLQKLLNDKFIAGENIKDLEEKKSLDSLIEELHELQGEVPLVLSSVGYEAIADVISLWTGIPVGNMVKDEVARLMKLEELIGKRVIGQVTPIKEISQAIRTSRAGLTDPRKPLGVFLMCGPSGVGKTETALALTDLLYGGEKNLITINMTEFKEEHKVSMLLGSPAGYVGYGKGGVLTEAVRRNPYSVLLLDEMEKAHPGVHDIFYQIFDKGSISDSEGRVVDFKNTIIIMTSNAGDMAVCDACKNGRPDIKELTKQISPALQKFFKPAFLGRATVVPYFPLNDEELGKIAQISLNRLKKRINDRYNAEFVCSDNVIPSLVERNTSPETGGRAIEQIINRTIMPNLANSCIMRLSEGLPINKVSIDCKDNEFIVDIS
ncbi:MAG: type VI secretion system ATPase TssH [Ruminobacter sp.]|nr:type VI secretion system ATPase TssH [Ruminobacter sp.]